MLILEQMKRLVLLARLGLSGEEIERYRADLAGILEYVGELKKVDTAGVEPLHNVLGMTNVLRSDDERILRDEHLAGKLAGMAPKQKDGFVSVPRVLYH